MPFGLYLHYPFCAYKCSYCDFYKEMHQHPLEQAYYKALHRETELAAELYANRDRTISTIFVGGGTPSLTNIELFAEWFAVLKKHFTVPEGIEFSLETSPDSVTVELLTALKQIGVTRPTVGVETFNEETLRKLRRGHSVEQIYKAVYLVNTLGFTHYATDLLFGLPKQTTKAASKDLDELIALNPPHISYYQLTIEPNTPLAKAVEAGTVKVPNSDLMLAIYRGGCERMEEAGYKRYEVSSFAKSGFECQHNLGYWEGNEYLALGPSGHSFMNNERFANVSSLVDYVQQLKNGQLPRIIDESGPIERMNEAIMLAFRTARGLNQNQFTKRFGIPFDTRINRQQYDIFVESGHILVEGDIVRLSEEGIYLADEITRRILL